MKANYQKQLVVCLRRLSLIVGVWIFGNGLLPAQYLPLDLSININSYSVGRFTEADIIIPPGYIATRIETEYGEYNLRRSTTLEKLEPSNIYSVNLIQSVHSTIGKRDELLLRRMFALASIMPRLIESKKTIQWNVYDQTNGTTQVEAKKLFHGYYIVHRPLYTKERGTSELKYIMDVAKGRAPLLDSTVFKVLARKSNWDSTVIVCDVTGSMSPYASQVLRWVVLQSKRDSISSSFIFFNDGDAKAETEKVIGSTGGLYLCNSRSLDSIYLVMTKAMTSGYGGDAPENDLEALIHAQSSFPKAKSLVLVCDNYATPRDMALISRLKLPVHVIVCGATEGYLDPTRLTIAYASKGTLHTMEDDIESLEKLRDGEEIRIGKNKYRLRDGEVILIED